LGATQLSIPVKTDFDSILEQFNRRESVNDLGYLNNYIPIVIEDGKNMSVELHPTAVGIPLSYYELLTTTGVSFRCVKQSTIDKLFLALSFTTGPAFGTLVSISI
jgi:hypothetical protein